MSGFATLFKEVEKLFGDLRLYVAAGATKHISPRIEQLRKYLRRRMRVAVAWLIVAIALAYIDRPPSWTVGIISFVPLVELLRLITRRKFVTTATSGVAIEAVAEVGLKKELKLIRLFFGALFAFVTAELVLGIYISLVPIWNAPEFIPIILLVVAAMSTAASAMMLLEKTAKGKRGALGLAMTTLVLIAIGITGVFFAGGVDEAIAQVDDWRTSASSGNSRAGQEVEVVGPITQLVTLLGESRCSISVDLSSGPDGENYAFGPEDTWIHWEDGTSGLITEWFENKTGPVCFTGPAGEKVTVIQIPHSA